MDRAGFMHKLKRFIKKYNVQPVIDIPAGAKIIVTRVEDFDPESNDVWQSDSNKSYPREGIECCGCHKPVVLSNALFRNYSINPTPELLYCYRCGFQPERKCL